MLLAAAAALTGASVQSATGFGFALVLSPALFAVLDPYEAVTALLALGLVLNLLVLSDSGLGEVQGRMLAPLVVAAAPGLVLGAVLLGWLSKPALQVGVGIAVLLAAALQWRARARATAGLDAPCGGGTGERGAERPGSDPAGGLSAALVGFASGVLTTSVSVSGPPIVLWLEARDLSPSAVRASLAATFLLLNVVGGAVVLASGGARAVELGVLLPLLALVVAGHALGALAFRRLDATAFSRVALALVAITGVASVVAGAAAS